MRYLDVLRAWWRVLCGRKPFLSIEITRECPLRCPGCYAYEETHLHGTPLRQLKDFRDQALIDRLLALVAQEDPTHVWIVGGDPLVRYRELNVLLPRLAAQRIAVNVVTSAFRPLPPEWRDVPGLRIMVSIDGLPPEHDRRRAPATYERILQNIAGSRITVHCTITSQMMQRPGYLDEFVAFWSERPEVQSIWMSMFTPQMGAHDAELLTREQRAAAVAELRRLHRLYPKLEMRDAILAEFLSPPASPEQCMFARTTANVSADLQTRITPCQFGGTPDCSQCGCMASVGFSALAKHRPLPGLSVGTLFNLSEWIGRIALEFARKHAVAAPTERQPERPQLVSLSMAPPPAETPAQQLIESRG